VSPARRATRSITFRLPEEDYQRLRLVCTSQGAKSVSDFIRSGVSWVVANGERRILDVVFRSFGGVCPRGEWNEFRDWNRVAIEASSQIDSEAERHDRLTDALAELRLKLDSLSRVVQTSKTGVAQQQAPTFTQARGKDRDC
jgi:hypothetical protein